MSQSESSPPKPGAPWAGISAARWAQIIFILAVWPAAVLFGSAGSLDWPMAWLYLGLSLAAFAVSRLLAWRAHPDLLRERIQMMEHKDAAPFDRLLGALLVLVAPTVVALVAGLALRFEWLPAFALPTQWAGVVVYLLGTALATWALLVNRFFSSVVRLQLDRGHHVVTSGPYAIVRHPGYLGAGVSYCGMVLILGSPWALIPFAFQWIVFVVRTWLEDRLLQASLPGYVDYARRIRFRLVPGLW